MPTPAPARLIRPDSFFRSLFDGERWRGILRDEASIDPPRSSCPTGAGNGETRRSRFKSFLPYGLIPLAVFGAFHQALTFHFWRDDWSLVGPPVAGDFLAHPLGIFASLQIYHYAPVARLWYALESVLFRGNPFPYHLLNLALLSAASILLYRLLLVYRFSALPALAGAVYYGFSATQYHNAAWITGGHHYLLAIPFILALICWENYLGEGRRKDLILTLAMVLTGHYIHNLGAIIPPLLLVRYHLSPRGGRKISPRRAWRDAGAMLALVLILNLAPRWAFSLEVSLGDRPFFDPFQLVETLWNSFARRIIPSLWGDLGLASAPSPPALILMGVSAMLFAAWLFRPRRWRLFLLGLALAVFGLILPYVVLVFFQFQAPGTFFTKPRFLVIPNLGIGMCLAVVVSGALSCRGRWAKPAAALVAALFMGLFLLQNYLATAQMYNDVWTEQDRWVDQAARKYVKAAREIAASSPCRRLVVVDVPLEAAWPGDPRHDQVIELLDHRFIHRFYFAGDEEMSRRFVFVKDRDQADRSRTGPGCVLTAFGGDLYAGDPPATGLR